MDGQCTGNAQKRSEEEAGDNDKEDVIGEKAITFGRLRPMQVTRVDSSYQTHG